MIGEVAFDRDGNVVVLDAVNYDVRIFRPDGSHLVSFGREGEGPMEFDTRPHSVTVAHRGAGNPVTAPRMSTTVDKK